jgi:hypothetical protein
VFPAVAPLHHADNLVLKSYDSEMHSPNDMMLDSQDDMIVEPTQNDADQVAIIEPDQLENGAEQLENVTLATDCAFSPTTPSY